MIEEEIQDTGQINNVKDVQKIEAAGKHLLALINDVLDLSKIEAGKMGLHVENFEVGMMIQEMVATLQPTIAKNSNTLDLHLAEDLGTMRSDITKVRQILSNLLSNACKFTDHGTITMNVDRTEATNDGSASASVTRASASAKSSRKISLKNLRRPKRFDSPQVWRHGPGSCDLPPIHAADGRKYQRGQ